VQVAAAAAVKQANLVEVAVLVVLVVVVLAL
jgi:hypothetical protein